MKTLNSLVEILEADMNSRGRVIKTLRHEEPDRVPVDLGAMMSTGIMGMAYNRLKD